MKKLQERKQDNKGFSLVELIIVIAIMAVLVAILAPAFMRYVEESRQKADVTAVDEVVQAVKAAYTNDEFKMPTSGAVTVVINDSADHVTPTNSADQTKFEDALKNSDVYNAKLKSSKWGNITISFTASTGSAAGALKVSVSNSTSSTSGAPNIADKYKK